MLSLKKFINYRTNLKKKKQRCEVLAERPELNSLTKTLSPVSHSSVIINVVNLNSLLASSFSPFRPNGLSRH